MHWSDSNIYELHKYEVFPKIDPTIDAILFVSNTNSRYNITDEVALVLDAVLISAC